MSIYFKTKAFENTNTLRVKKQIIAGSINDKIIDKHFISDIDDFSIIAEIYKHVIPGDIFKTYKDIPVIYMTILYNKKILLGSLFKYILYFEPDRNINSITDTTIETGKFYLIIECDDELKQKIGKLGEKIYIDNFISIKNVINKFNELCKDSEFLEIIKNGICIRNNKRQEKGKVFNYDINPKIINLNNIKNNPKLLDDLLDHS